jgi:hypothetical protein
VPFLSLYCPINLLLLLWTSIVSFQIVEFEPHLWEVVYSGEITTEIRNAALTEFLAQADKDLLKGVYVDFRHAELKMTTADQYAFAERIAESPLFTYARHALLHRPEEVHQNRFIETVARNRGRMVRIFSDKAETIAWLQGGKDRPTSEDCAG